MTLLEFIKKWNGKKCDYDGSYGAQCVDLFRQYVKEVWEDEQLPPVEGAKDFYKHVVKNPLKYYVSNYISNGDVLIYGATNTNPHGHICIVVSVLDVDNFVVFEQDGYNQNGAKLNIRTRENLLCSFFSVCGECKIKSYCTVNKK